jgi:hypothetical protein
VYDSSAKLPSGILRGNVNQLGDFDQCLSVVAQENPNIVGKYCLASVDVQATALNSSDTNTLERAVELAQAYGLMKSSYRDVSFMSNTPNSSLRRAKPQTRFSVSNLRYENEDLSVHKAGVLYAKNGERLIKTSRSELFKN